MGSFKVSSSTQVNIEPSAIKTISKIVRSIIIYGRHDCGKIVKKIYSECHSEEACADEPGRFVKISLRSIQQSYRKEKKNPVTNDSHKVRLIMQVKKLPTGLRK